ncbi:MAG: DUF5658 family protein [Thiogranum sp.]|nr:DUF5658 family protein [Thiogranum sp.]
MSRKQLAIAGSGEGRTTSDRRNQNDRRSHSLRTLTYCGIHGRGRRRTARRDKHDYYLDWYEPRLVLTGLAVLLMSCLDAMFTLTLLNRGAYEANQLMAILLEIDQTLFVTVKIGITGAGVMFLLMHSHFNVLRVFNGRKLLQWMVPVYGLLISYELVLLRSGL